MTLEEKVLEILRDLPPEEAKGSVGLRKLSERTERRQEPSLEPARTLERPQDRKLVAR